MLSMFFCKEFEIVEVRIPTMLQMIFLKESLERFEIWNALKNLKT